MAKRDFRHGFKAEAERIALELRAELDLGADGPLDPGALAEPLCVPIRALRDLAGVARDDVRHFLGRGRSAFSAATIYVGRFKRLIITNPAHATTRQMSSLCHELSHIVLDHEAEAPVNVSGGRAWNGSQEKEADWLAIGARLRDEGCGKRPPPLVLGHAAAGRSKICVRPSDQPLGSGIWLLRMRSYSSGVTSAITVGYGVDLDAPNANASTLPVVTVAALTSRSLMGSSGASSSSATIRMIRVRSGSTRKCHSASSRTASSFVGSNASRG